MNRRAKLIYISAPGHSGTTILDLLCGSIPSAFSMGEVHFFSWQLFQGASKEDPQTWCSCGSDFRTCNVYGPILEEINKREGIDIFESPEKYDFSLVRRLERYKTSHFKRIINKFLSLVIKIKLTQPLAYIPYLFYYKSIKRSWLLFDKVASRTKSEYVIDSSKSFLRFWLLKMHRPSDVKLIIIKRSILGVASSSHEGLNQAIIDNKVEQWINYYTKKIKPIKFLSKSELKFIKYEDLCANPEQKKKEIANFLNIDSKSKDAILRPFESHTIQGNPIRLLKKEVKIRHDDRFRKRLTKEQVELIEEIDSRITKQTKWITS